MSISAQQVPYLPAPEEPSVPPQPSTLACERYQHTHSLHVSRTAKTISTHLAVDKLDILRTLAVAVPRPILGTSLVPREARQPTILIHLAEIHSTIQTTR